MFIFLVCMSLALFDSSQSASFECIYSTGGWGTLGSTYYCSVRNSVSITSPNAAAVDSITEDHKAGYNNDNVEVFSVYQGQIHYFPRGLNKFFKNIKGILITNTGLKEIHQSDLKNFPQLKNLYLYSSQLEVLEENLFEFNPNLEYIYLISNKISHIHPNVFDKLTQLKTLWFGSNPCINMDAWYNTTAVQSVIKAAKAQCTNAEYSKLEQKVKNLEIESKNLNSENLKEKLQNLENEMKNSKFPNFFQEKLQGLKAFVIDKLTTTPRPTTTTITDPKTTTGVANLKDLLAQDPKTTDSNKNDEATNHNDHCSAIKEEMTNFTETMDTRLENLEIEVQNLKTASLRQIEKIENDMRTGHVGILRAVNVKADKIERKIEEQNQKIEEQSKKIEEINEKLAKIMKALKIDE